jgi:ribosomal 50S subunit-associated protein YjgA (DUF615 family)
MDTNNAAQQVSGNVRPSKEEIAEAKRELRELAEKKRQLTVEALTRIGFSEAAIREAERFCISSGELLDEEAASSSAG